MEVSTLTMLKDLDLSPKDIKLKVRITRLWRLPYLKVSNQDYSIEMILIDEEFQDIFDKQIQEMFTLDVIGHVTKVLSYPKSKGCQREEKIDYAGTRMFIKWRKIVPRMQARSMLVS